MKHITLPNAVRPHIKTILFGPSSDVFKLNTQLFTQLVRCVWMCKWSFVARAAHSLRLVSTLEWKWYSSDSVIFPSLEVVINVTLRDPENFSLRSEPQKDLCSRVGCPLTSLSGICQSKAEYNLAGSSVYVYVYMRFVASSIVFVVHIQSWRQTYPQIKSKSCENH